MLTNFGDDRGIVLYLRRDKFNVNKKLRPCGCTVM